MCCPSQAASKSPMGKSPLVIDLAEVYLWTGDRDLAIKHLDALEQVTSR
jgi:hypothetical protein